MADTRRTRAWVVAVALAAVLGVLAWWLFSGDRDTARLEPADRGSATANGSLGDPRLKPEPKLGLRGAPTATITGTIRDPASRPIADAQVCAVTNSFARRGAVDPGPRCVQSDREGRYAIAELLPIATEVHASAATYQPGRWHTHERGVVRTELRLRAGQTRADVDLTLEPGGVLVQGVVKDIAGGEIEGAQLRLTKMVTHPVRASTIVFSGDAGRFSAWVAPGVVDVDGSVDGYAPGSVIAQAPGEWIELYLTPESVLIGRVVLASTGAAVEGIEVVSGSSGETSLTDAAGRFRIERLSPGIYKPIATGETGYGEAADQVHLGLGQTSDEVLIRVHPAVVITGHVVVAGSDRPCTDGAVQLTDPSVGARRGHPDDDGRVEIRAVLPGTYRVRVDCDGYVSEADYADLVVAADTASPEPVWTVREGLAIRGEIVDGGRNQGQRGLATVNVHARHLVDAEDTRAQSTNAYAVSEADGGFELVGLLPGRYELTTPSWNGRPGPAEPIVVELDGGADVNDVQVVMPAVGRIRGRVVDERGVAVGKARLSATTLADNFWAEALANDAGEFTIDGLLPGPTRVTVYGEEFGRTMRKPGTSDDDVQGELVEAVANEVVEVVITVEAADGRITGVVEDSDGSPVADAFIHVDRMSDSAGANTNAARRSVRWSFGEAPVLTDADGRFVLDGLPDGEFIVRANREGGGEALAERVALGSDVRLVIATTASLSGTVTLADGSAPERFTVLIEDKQQGIQLTDHWFRTDGVWRLTEIPPGSYEISASAGVGTANLAQPIVLAVGDQREDVTLILAGRVTVRGRVVDLDTREPIAGISVVVRGRTSSSRRTNRARLHVTDVDGRFELEDAPIGPVTLAASNHAAGSAAKYDYLFVPLTLAADPSVQELGEIELVRKRLDPGARAGDLGFTITEPDPAADPAAWAPTVASIRVGGPASATALTVGAVITKVDGHDVLGANGDRYRTLTAVPEGTSVELEFEDADPVTIVAGPPA